ncbi:hypothetical protein ABZS66_42285 [Dactylosporangium sp. NPDC005572]|uniref:hypothetical protein n=1 Tax=Dactylosporangium sp. NPDC005572 TaxID=3156889 RepID=UPI0033BE2A05
MLSQFLIEFHRLGLPLEDLPRYLLAYEPFNPDPKAPTPGVEESANTLISWIKWGALGLVISMGVGGIGTLAGGKLTNNSGWSTRGQQMMGGSVILAILFGTIYEIIQQFTKVP